MQIPHEKFSDKGKVEDDINLVVYNEMTHLWGRPGDQLVTHFQCDICHFGNVEGGNSMSHIFRMIGCYGPFSRPPLMHSLSRGSVQLKIIL